MLQSLFRFPSLIGILVAPVLFAGCMAYGAEPGSGGDVLTNIFLRMAEVSAPMAAIMLWFMYTTKARDERDAERAKARDEQDAAREKLRDERESAQRAELIRLIEACTSAISRVDATLAHLAAGYEKHRAALYQLDRDVREMGNRSDGTPPPPPRSRNTEIRIGDDGEGGNWG